MYGARGTGLQGSKYHRDCRYQHPIIACNNHQPSSHHTHENPNAETGNRICSTDRIQKMPPPHALDPDDEDAIRVAASRTNRLDARAGLRWNLPTEPGPGRGLFGSGSLWSEGRGQQGTCQNRPCRASSCLMEPRPEEGPSLVVLSWDLVRPRVSSSHRTAIKLFSRPQLRASTTRPGRAGTMLAIKKVRAPGRYTKKHMRGYVLWRDR